MQHRRSRFKLSVLEGHHFFVLEDDAQDGPDHIDSHRSVMFVIPSAYNGGGVIHRFVNTTDVFATMEEILGINKLSKFDYYLYGLCESSSMRSRT